MYTVAPYEKYEVLFGSHFYVKENLKLAYVSCPSCFFCSAACSTLVPESTAGSSAATEEGEEGREGTAETERLALTVGCRCFGVAAVPAPPALPSFSSWAGAQFYEVHTEMCTTG